MTDRNDLGRATAQVLDRDEIEGVLSSRFHTAERVRPAENTERSAKPTHYKVICISMYTDDLKRLDEMVDTLKARGLTKANRSALIRYALGEVKLDEVPKGL